MSENKEKPLGKYVRFKTGGMDPREYAYSKSKSPKSFPTVYIEDKEKYARFVSNVNNEYHIRHIGRKISSQDIGDYTYTFEVYDFDSYRVIGRTKISDTNTGLQEGILINDVRDRKEPKKIVI